MSRIGKQPITIPSGVKVAVNGCEVTVEGKGGKLSFTHKPQITVAVDFNRVEVILVHFRECDCSYSARRTRFVECLLACLPD